MEFASSSHTGIARRVQRQVGRKRKLVESPFITSVTKYKKTNVSLNKQPSRADIEVQPNKMNKGTDEKVPPTGLDIVEVASEAKIEAHPAKLIVDYAGRLFISNEKCIFIDNCTARDYLAYHAYKEDTTENVSHITKESVSAANLMLVPIIEKSHWTLLVGNLKIKPWHLQISHLYDEIRNSFETDIRVWPIRQIKLAPT
ncbi:hypothetical protein IEQ34_009675 [Dendrobium chrysotoxum]|uniref:Ubiquitin-like protease family profile domain-containing protein n=1 Tax=Dendrobium chrysotoxum TaxID=161865 RepID=A0AAV7H1E8_DENCH|nr:hypothetical protein IEQ34_009675 [Dendrobium chrysotoxum]